jgi:hypothetical protein
MLPLPHRINGQRTKNSQVNEPGNERRREREEDFEFILWFEKTKDAEWLATARGSQRNDERERGLDGEIGRECLGLEGCELRTREDAEGNYSGDKAL